MSLHGPGAEGLRLLGVPSYSPAIRNASASALLFSLVKLAAYSSPSSSSSPSVISWSAPPAPAAEVSSCLPSSASSWYLLARGRSLLWLLVLLDP